MYGRVLGKLAVTRAFGDFECKNIMVENKETGIKERQDFVLCEPEVRVTTLNK